MGNPFDQFDTHASEGSNPFDQFDAPKNKQNKGIAADLVTDVKRGVQQLPGAVTGLIDIPVAAVTGSPLVSGLADKAGEITGFQPSKWAKSAEAEYSPSRQAGRAEVDNAWEQGTVSDIAGAYLKNPMNIVGSVAESIPSMLVGGLAGRAALGIGAKTVSAGAGGVGAALPGVIARTVGTSMAPAVGAGIGEGGIMAGQAMQNSLEAGVDPRTAAGYAGATGLIGGALGTLGGKVAQKFGVVDPETLIAGGIGRQASNATGMAAAKEVGKRVAGGAISEGLFEELPQSVFEQGFQNLAQDKPLTEGMARAGVEGALAGSFMGGAFNAIPGGRYAESKINAQAKPQDEQQPIAGLLPPPTYTGTPGGQIVENDAARQAAIDAADKNAAELYAMREAFEKSRQGITLVADPVPVQQRIDAMLGLDTARMDKNGRALYEKDLAAAFNEPIGIRLDANQNEVPFTMGEYLDAQVKTDDAVRARERIPAQNANQQSVTRLGVLAEEEAQQQVALTQDLARSAAQGGALSKAALSGMATGATQIPVHPMRAAIEQQMLSDEAAQAELAPIQRQMQSRSTEQVQRIADNEKAIPKIRQAAIADLQRRVTAQAQPTTTSPLQQTTTQLNMPAQNIPTNTVTNVQAGAEQNRNPVIPVWKKYEQNGVDFSFDEFPVDAEILNLRRIASNNQKLGINGDVLHMASDSLRSSGRLGEVSEQVAAATAAPATPEAQKADNRAKLEKTRAKNVGPQSRDDLLGAILRVTGGNGIHPKMAQTIVGDKANAATKVRGLFTLRGQEDLDDIADLLRVQENYDVRDGNHLAELVREQAAGNPVYSMERNEREAAENEVRKYRDEIRRRAAALGIKTVAIKFDNIERAVLEAEAKQAQDEAVAERDAIQAEEAVSGLDDDQINALLDLATQETKENGRYINEQWISNDEILDAFDGTETLEEPEDAQGAARAGEADAGDAGRNRQGRGDEAGFDLAAQTPEQLRAKAEQERAAAAQAHREEVMAIRAEQAAKNKAEKDRRAAQVLAEREAAKKAEVDKDVEVFALGQNAPPPVVKKVTTEDARGQQDIVAQQQGNELVGAFTIRADGIEGKEIPASSIPNGSDAFQYALGKTEDDGATAIFRRKASERGTYGGWRWEADAQQKPSEPVANSSGYTPPTSTREAEARWRAGAGESKPERGAGHGAIMASVQKALDAGLFYNTDVNDFVAKELGVTAEQRKLGTGEDPNETMPVDGGAFGYDVYYARKAVESGRSNDAEARAAARMKLAVGMNIGRILLNDNKIASAATVESISDTSVTLVAKRGPQTIRTTLGYVALEHYAERAENNFFKKKSRSDEAARGADDLLAPAQQKAKPVAQPKQQSDANLLPALEDIASRLGVTVERSRGGYHASSDGQFVSVPQEDKDAEGALSANHILAHELGHAVIARRGMNFSGMPISAITKTYVPNWIEFVGASKAFRPAVWNHANEKIRNHAKKPSEVLADAIASVLMGSKPVSMLKQFMENTGTTLSDLGLQSAEEANAEYAKQKQDRGEDQQEARPARTDKIGSGAEKPALEEYLSEEPRDRNALNATVEFRQPDGTTLKGPRHVHIEAAVRDGHSVVLTKNGPALVDKNMRGWNKDDLGAAGMSYANWLVSKRDAQPKAEPAKAQSDDWLNAMFGQAPSAEQAEKENADSVKSAQDKADRVDAAIAMLSGEIEANNAAAAELAARKYKANRKQIELQGDGPGRNGSMSISAINESRKRRAIEASLNASSAIKKAIEFISEDADSAFKQVLDMEAAVTKQFNEGFFGKSAKLDDQLDMAVGSMIGAGSYSGNGSAGRKLRMAAHAYFAKAQEPAAKEPWQMTIAEFDAAKKRVYWPMVKEHGRIVPASKGVGAHFELNDDAPADIKTMNAVMNVSNHESAVSKGIREGKPVPANVLADYPDLKPAAVDAVKQPETKAAEQEAKVNHEDVGGEMTYNKRNRLNRALKWEDVQDKEAALRVKEVTKAKVSPKPDYQAMIDEGMEPLIAHMVKQAYDSLPSKPVVRGAPTDEQLQIYITAMNRYMDGVMSWAKNPDSVRAFVSGIAKRASALRGAYGGAMTDLSKLNEAIEGKALLETVYPGGWKNFEQEVKILNNDKMYAGLQPSTNAAIKAMKDIEKGWPSTIESWQRQGYSVKPSDGLVSVKREDYAGDSYFVVVNGRINQGNKFATKEEAEKAASEVKPYLLLDKYGRVVSQFETEELATEAAREKVKREANSDQVKEEGIAVASAERTGPARRNEGEDISTDRIKETFGFKGINFGNWMKGNSPALRTERQLHLNFIYDSFLDLADILNIPPKAMSLNGLLGIAVGAQGSGKALAHFVPGVNEINITRTAGAGALAHEWGHALDHNYARLAGLDRLKEPYLTEHTGRTTGSRVVTESGRNRMVYDQPVFAEGLRPEMLAKFKAVVQAMNKRMETMAEYTARKESYKEISKKRTEDWIKSVRRDFERSAPINNAAEFMAKFDKLADRMRVGDLGEGYISVSRNVDISPVVNEIRKLYKDATGRIYSLDQSKGLQFTLDSLKHSLTATPAEAGHVPQQVSSNYYNQSAKADRETKRTYWNTNLEKFARAFDAFVTDTISERAAKNTYLSGIEAVPPMGEERKAINAAIRDLVSEFKTKETEQGTALYSKSDAANTESFPRAQAESRIKSILGDKLGKVLIDSGIVTLVDTEQGLRNLNGAKYMVAWHGSPHDHNKFDSSKIGTGEGAQAYGYGLYFAGDKAVAEHYRRALSKTLPRIPLLNGKPLEVPKFDFKNRFDPNSKEASLTRVQLLLLQTGNLDSAIKRATGVDIDLLESFRGKISFDRPPGNIYQVELAPSEDEYLDWDKPLSEQSEKVKAALSEIGLPVARVESDGTGFYVVDGEGRNEFYKTEAAAKEAAKRYNDKSGSQIYKLLSDFALRYDNNVVNKGFKEQGGGSQDKAASDYLHSIGIRGIRYLDGSSRSAGEGNSNYVIFSDDDVSITAKYAKENGGIQGATFPDGRIALVLENLNANNFDGIFAHEGFHSTIRDLVGEQTYTQMMKRLENMGATGNARQWFKDAEAAIPSNTKAENRTEELAAYALEQYTNGTKQPNVIRQWVESLLSALRTAIIRRLPFGKLKSWAVNNLQPQDLANLAIAGLKAKAQGQLQAQGREAMAYSRNEGVQSSYGLPNEQPGNRAFDRAEIRALRRLAAGMERPEAGITFRITDDGIAIATGPKGTRVPERYIRFANDNGLAFESRRLPISGGTEAPAMPAIYRTDGALYFGEMASNARPIDRTGKTRFSKINQTDTPAFKKWFGDSKVVDADGKPLVVYHGTRPGVSIETFRARHETDGIYFTPDPDYASGFTNPIGRERDGAGAIYPVYLSAQNPYVVTAEYDSPEWNSFVDRGINRVDLKKNGYDAAILREPNGTIDQVIAFEPNQIKSAIGNNGNFDGTNPDIRYSRAQIIGDSGRQYEPAQRQFFKNVGRDIEKKNLVERTTESMKNDFWKKMAVGIVDQFRGLRDLGDNGQAYMLARLSKGTAGAFDALLHHGKLSIRDGVYDADTSGGFIERLGAPLHGELDDFLWYVAANRAEGLSKVDRENLFTPADIAAGKSLAKGQTNFDYTIQTGAQKGTTTRNRATIYADANRVFNEFQKNTLDMAEQSGLIDGASRKLWESEFYVPFYRVSEEDGEFIGSKMGNALVRQQAFKKLKGGTDKLNSDLLSNTLLNFSHLIEASAKNRAAKASLEAAEKIGAAHKATYGEKKTVWYMGDVTRTIPKGQKYEENGVENVSDGTAEITYVGKVEYGVDDPFVMTAITSLEYAGMRNGIMDVMTKFKHWLTIGVTASPAFKVRNLIRDSIQSIGASELGYNPIKNIAEGYKQTQRDSQEYVSALASGGLIRFGTMLEGSESARVRQLVKAGVKDSTILNSENKWRAFYDQYLDTAVSAYNELGNRSEEINRAALYNQLVKQGKSHAEAALLARDLMDFSMQGSFNTIRFLTQVVPFMNARLQGMYKLGRSAKDNPRKLAVVTGAVALASIALMLAYGDDDDWKRREDWDRDNFWWFKFGDVEFRIPKPFEVGAIGTLAERGLELMIDDEMTGERFRNVVNSLVMNNLSMNPIPQAFKPILDLYANKDSFTKRPIESLGMQRLDPTERFNSNTSMVARGMSNASLGALSPVQIDHLARAYFGWLGSFVIGGADMVSRSVSDEPTKPALDYFRFGTQGILKEAGTGSSRYVTQVYEQAKELEQVHATYRQMIKDGRIDEAKDYAEDNLDQMIRYRQVETVKNMESKLNERIRKVERSDMDSDQKKDAIALINKQKEQVAKRIAVGA